MELRVVGPSRWCESGKGAAAHTLAFAMHVDKSGRLLDRLLFGQVNWHSRPDAVLEVT